MLALKGIDVGLLRCLTWFGRQLILFVQGLVMVGELGEAPFSVSAPECAIQTSVWSAVFSRWVVTPSPLSLS